MTVVYTIGWIAIVVGVVKVYRYLHAAVQAQDTITESWFKEHEYRGGKRGWEQ